MMEEPWYLRVQREAAERLRTELDKPLDPEPRVEDGYSFVDGDDAFDPWSLFPALYGTYGSDFDACAIQVLMELENGKKIRDDLGAEMFREMLCTAELCSYGTSPRVCFWNHEYRDLLTKLRERWQEFSLAQWGHAVWVGDGTETDHSVQT